MSLTRGSCRSMLRCPEKSPKFVVMRVSEEGLESDLLTRETLAGELIAEFDRLILEMRDVPSTALAVKRLVLWLRNESRRSFAGGWRLCGELLRGHELGRLLRTDPMVRRCQWRPAGSGAYALVEPFVQDWDDAREVLVEAE